MSARSEKPNFIVIVTDQEYAHQALPEGVALPNRDRLRSNGVTFNNHQVTTTVCTPSRSVMWTGQHTPFTGMFDNTNLAWIENMSTDPESLPTIGHLLRALGYYTAYKGKWHESEFQEGDTTDALEPYGFSDYQATGEVQGGPMDGFTKDPQIAADSVAWLKDRSPEVGESQPWLLAVNFVNPHDIMYFDTDDEELEQVRGMFPIFGAPDAPLYQKQWQTELPASFSDDLSQHPTAVQDYKDISDGMYGRIPVERQDMWNNHVNYYINCMIDVDRHIGAVLDALEQSGQAENTVIIFTADHGEMGGAHHLRQKGSVAFQETVNVPLVIVDPRAKSGVTTDAIGSHLDLVPTMLALAGLSTAERKQKYPFLKGHDLSGLVVDSKSDGPRGSSNQPGKGALYTYDMVMTVDIQWLLQNAPRVLDTAAAEAGVEFVRGTENFKATLEEIGTPNLDKRELYRGIFDGRYKLIRYFGLAHYNKPQSVQELFENNDVGLYDLLSDPGETNNLANVESPDYDESLLSEMNSKLNALIDIEIGEDGILIELPS